MKKIFLLFLLLIVSLNAENRYSFAINTAQREVTVAEAIDEEKEGNKLYLSLEAFFSVDGWSNGNFQQGPVFTLFDITNEDDSFSDYVHAGWQTIWEFRDNLELITSIYAVLDRSLYKDGNDNHKLAITLRDGYGAKLALRIALFDDFGIDLATAKFEVNEDGEGNYTYTENSISLVWWF